MLLTQPDPSVPAPRESNANAAVSHIEDALTSRLLQSTIHALELYSIYLGKELGLYAALQSGEMARAFPQVDVIGFDADEASIADARGNAVAQQVAVRFEVRDAVAIADHGPFDLIVVLEALHDMARPTEVLRSLRQTLAPEGRILVADEKVADTFHAPGDDIERLMYGWSIVHCLPVSLAGSPSTAIGTVIRADAIRELAGAAGFVGVDVLPVNAGVFRIYRLSPP
jgi:SAM-dependent methyltransferase